MGKRTFCLIKRWRSKDEGAVNLEGERAKKEIEVEETLVQIEKISISVELNRRM